MGQQVKAAEAIHARAVMEGVPVKLPHLYAKKNPKSAFQRRWFWLFPQTLPCRDPRCGGRVWWHCLDSTVQRAMRTANRRAGTEGITPHHLRHAWATYSHEDGAHLRDLQEVLGHKNIETTARYVRPDPERVPSPFERLKLIA
jgi:integrase